MFKELFTNSSLLDLPILSMLLFIAVFGAVLAWVFAGKRKSHYQDMARLPLEEKEK